MSRVATRPEYRSVIDHGGDFGRVAVMLGGSSVEREVSLDSGGAVLKALQSRGVDAHAWDPAEKSLVEFAKAGFDRVWIALHGTGGEDGSLQGAADAILAVESFGFPIILKPAGQGSSVGMSKVFGPEDLNDAVELSLAFGGVALAERCIVGGEHTVAVLQGEALPSIRIETPRVFYDYRAKYESDRTEYHCPGTTDAETEALYAGLAIAAFNELGCSGWGRVDFMTGEDGQPQVLEANTVPGMTSHSLVPMAANKAGIDFAELCWRILETSVGEDIRNKPLEVAANDA